MSDNWDSYFMLVDGEPASIFVDLGIASSVPVQGLAEMAYLRVAMRSPREDGLSSEAEFDELIALEDAICAAAERGGQTMYVGRNTSDGNRDFYFYTGDRGIEGTLRTAMAQWPDYRFETGTRADPDWAIYREFLYPSPADMQRIANRGVITQLMNHGDDLDLSRQIDHLAYLPSMQAVSAFEKLVSADGFVTTDVHEDNGSFAIHFRRPDCPSGIDDATIEIDRLARELGGEYDGWGCEVAG